MGKQLVQTLQQVHIPLKTENQRVISKFSRLMNTINKLEERMDAFRNEMCLFFRISQIIKPTSLEPLSTLQQKKENLNIFREKSLSEEINENEIFLSDDECEKTSAESHKISNYYGDYAKKLAIGSKLQNFVEIYHKMKEKKAEHVEFFESKLKDLLKEMTLFKELDNPRLLYLLRKVQKLKQTLISLLPENQNFEIRAE